jgi:hypothetical protein
MHANIQAEHKSPNLTLYSKKTLTTERQSQLQSYPSLSQKQSVSMNCSARPDIEKLWEKMISLYGRGFTQQFGIKADGAGMWQTALSLLSKEDIDYGIKKLMITSKYTNFPPNPMQFKEVCLSRRESLQLPSLKDAFLEARNFYNSRTHLWSHHAVKFCVVKLGIDVLETPFDAVVFKKFKPLYEKACLAVEQGITLPELQFQNTSSTYNMSVGERHLSQLKNLLKKEAH